MDNFDQEIEQFLLGGLLHNNDAIFDLNIQPDDFYFGVHELIFDKMRSDANKYGQFNYGTLSQWAKGHEFIDGESGNKYIMALMDSCITSTAEQLKIYAKTLREYSQKRNLHETLTHAIRNLERPESKTHEILSDINSVLKKNINTDVLLSGQEVFNRVLDGIKKPSNCFKTGLNGLDEATGGGFYAGWTYGFCGAEKSGKTMLATTLAYNMTKLGCKALYIALEMGSVQIEQRSIARQLGFNPLDFLDNQDKVVDKIVEAEPNDNLTYLDMPGATLDEILLNIAKAKAKIGIDGFILDYWQLVRSTDRIGTEEKHLRDVAQFLSDFARKNGLFCIILAQMNQDGRLFGGNGLRKACDQLYMIEQYEDPSLDKHRWLRMDASRYTMRGDLGSEDNPYMKINYNGAFFDEV